jgi:hypothetical protein
MDKHRLPTVAVLALAMTSTLAADDRGASRTNALERIERRIAKEPRYESTPRYVLLAFGPEAKQLVWLVEDGRQLYIDRNGNGDLTDDGPPVTPGEVRELGDGRWDFDYQLDEFALPDGSSQTDFRLARWNYGESEHDGYGLSLTLDGEIPMYAGWTQFWTDDPESAQVFHFGGQLEPRKLRGPEFVIGSDPGRLSFAFINTGTSDVAHTRLAYEAIPSEVIPEVKIDWPTAAGNPTIRTTHLLSQRCCYWEFYLTDFEIPPGVVKGTAIVTVSLPNYVSPIGFATNRIDVPVTANSGD